MNIEEFVDYCQNKKGVEQTTPFGPDTLVMKVMGKMFSATGLKEGDFRVNLKCDPELALEYRASYPGRIIPGYHMNKKHWNTVYMEQGLSDDFIRQMIDQSYDLVVKSLTKKVRKELDEL